MIEEENVDSKKEIQKEEKDDIDKEKQKLEDDEKYKEFRYKRFVHSTFEVDHPEEIFPMLEDSQDKLFFAHRSIEEGQEVPYMISLGMEESKDPLELEEYTKKTVQHLLELIKTENVQTDFHESLVKDTKLHDIPAKEVTYRVNQTGLTSYQIWAVDGWRSYTVSCQCPHRLFERFEKTLFKHVIESFTIREQNGWQHISLEPFHVQEKAYNLYLPLGWEYDEACLNVKYVYNKKDLNIKITLEISDEKTKETDPKHFLKKEDIEIGREIKLANKYPAFEVIRLKEEKMLIEATAIAEGRKYKLVFKTFVGMMCVKTYAIWRSILQFFTFEDLDKDKRHIYINAFHNFGLKIPNSYRALSSNGRTATKLWGVHGHSHKLWVGDESAFPEPVNQDNLVEIWKRYHLSGFKVSPKTRKVKVSGFVASEVSFDVQNNEVISQIIYHNGNIIVTSFKVDKRDPAIQYFFLDTPLLEYTEAKKNCRKSNNRV
jgi:hypothetical protein